MNGLDQHYRATWISDRLSSGHRRPAQAKADLQQGLSPPSTQTGAVEVFSGTLHRTANFAVGTIKTIPALAPAHRPAIGPDERRPYISFVFPVRSRDGLQTLQLRKEQNHD